MLEIFLIGITVFHKNRDYPRLSNIKRQKYQEVFIKFYSTGRNDPLPASAIFMVRKWRHTEDKTAPRSTQGKMSGLGCEF